MSISRRQYLLSIATGIGFGMQRSTRPPNLVVILADDLGYGDLGVYGSTTIRTPQIDAMAKEGARLTDFYATPTCTPSRAALLTGRYPIRSGLVRVLQANENFGIPKSEITLAEKLKSLGYATALIGKWHLGSPPRFRPNRHGFDFYYGLLYSNDMTIEPPNLRRLRLYRNETPIEWPVHQDTLTKRYTEQAVAFIEANRTKPFFLYLAHSMPHVPLHASEQFRGHSKGGLYGDAVEEIDWSTGQTPGYAQKVVAGREHTRRVYQRQWAGCEVEAARRQRGSLPRGKGFHLGRRNACPVGGTMAGSDPPGDRQAGHRVTHGRVPDIRGAGRRRNAGGAHVRRRGHLPHAGR